MALEPQQIRRYARQLTLPEVGPEGQARLLAAQVTVVREGPAAYGDAAATAALYLEAAGVGRVSTVPAPRDGEGALADWRAAIGDADVLVRFALDDDALLAAAAEAGVPLVVGRIHDGAIALLSVRHHGACAHPRPTGARVPADRDADAGATAVVLGTLAAAEVLWMLIDPARAPAARVLKLPFDGDAPSSADIPWPPVCPLCARAAAESVKFS